MKKSLVYTKTGDKGLTSLVGGKRVPKAHIRLEAYGTTDELNSFIGFLMAEIDEGHDMEVLLYIQNKLFNVGSYLATDTETTPPKEASIITDRDIALLETEMDRMDSELPPLSQFVLPGGSESAARAHICRTVCRRTERCIYRVKEVFPVDDQILMFVNRLSDYFFLLARKESNKKGKEIFWNQSLI
ncbi:cob(I)yrinic acid a,c-diamide adenosyltransferase [Prevotella sp. 10(H)]|uniref:cob(I)yrinic acid a,c-diamide adenosyltransferase n=1 Tax=Prevotella sp. 10(H) TaxID=1158294 RepID=UPI0004A70028|nr:cob(I)yrinic acid a,c-diamide adenosyltransferase [Prevotella sp. 10(H)]